MKHLVVTFSDGSRWAIPARFIAEHRAKYYAQLDAERDGADYDTVFKLEVDYALNDNYELTDWTANNMNWADVVPVAIRLHDEDVCCDYGREWSTFATKKIVNLRDRKE